ncbi:hypothetical protein [Vibrio sp. D431a]|uniref:hypothetical protein n=1 Tax=Vibrio sp. D431a TaxID=2837388 RepID=UPI002554C6BD|nr:hypothetical protein [Vibrio sp. D431a]MDK9793731.1 hypothetical protein [Vibrio sp. D431a]
MNKKDWIKARDERIELAKELTHLSKQVDGIKNGKASLNLSIKHKGGETDGVQLSGFTSKSLIEKLLCPEIERINNRIEEIDVLMAKAKKKPIPLWTECKKERDEMALAGVYAVEECVFCTSKTNLWHIETNNPICLCCANLYYVSEIPEDFGENNRKALKAGTFDYGTSVRAN